MEWIEVTGDTLEEAKELALDRLGVSDDDLEIEVVTEPRSGFLGMGRADARIRARVKPVSREKPDSRRSRRSGRGGRDQRSRSHDTTTQAGGNEPTSVDESNERGRRRRSSAHQRPEKSGVAKSDTAREARMLDDDFDEVTLEEQCASARVFLEGVVDALDLDATVSASAGEQRVEASIDGEDLGHLIGPGAATLTALEELTQAVVQSKSAGHASRVRLDVAGYRERRREALEEFTRRQADRVFETGGEVVLEPMGAPDRKVVHDIVAELEGVTTTSEGEDPRRRVVIRPAGD